MKKNQDLKWHQKATSNCVYNKYEQREKTRKHNNFKRGCLGMMEFMEIISVALNKYFI